MIERGFCLGWDTTLIVATSITTGVISLAYFLIPLVLYTVAAATNFKIPLTFRNALVWFAAFIFLCGLSRLMDIFLIWVPLYWVKVILDGATGVASMIALVYIVPLAKRFIRYSSLGKK